MAMPTFAQETREVVSQAHATAKAAGAEAVEIEHLLLAIMETDPSGDAAACLASAGLTVGAIRPLADTPSRAEAGGHMEFAALTKIAVQLAGTVADAKRAAEITTTHLLWGVVQAANDRVAALLVPAGTDVERFRDSVFSLVDIA